jgi:hypothetical protein
MLYEEKYTIEGVRKKLNKIYNASGSQMDNKKEIIERVKIKLREILDILS